jgi:hypothetical protein
MSPKPHSWTRTYNVHSDLPSPKPYITLILRTCGLELCGESDLCMHCDVDEMTSRIANSNHATKTRLDIGSAPVIPVEPWSWGRDILLRKICLVTPDPAEHGRRQGSY